MHSVSKLVPSKKNLLILIWLISSSIFLFKTINTTYCKPSDAYNELGGGLCNLGYTADIIAWVYISILYLNISYILLLSRNLQKGEYFRKLIGLLTILLFLIFFGLASSGRLG